MMNVMYFGECEHLFSPLINICEVSTITFVDKMLYSTVCMEMSPYMCRWFGMLTLPAV